MKRDIYYASIEDPRIKLLDPDKCPSLVALGAKIDLRKRIVTFPILDITFSDVLKIARAIITMETDHERS